MQADKRFTVHEIQLAAATLLVCSLPWLCNLFGIDFSSQSLSLASLATSDGFQQDHLFHTMTGAFHHALLEWSGVSVAVIAALISILHYRVYRDLAVPIMGLAVFCAGMVDAFHTLAATRLISAQAPNGDFISPL